MAKIRTIKPIMTTDEKLAEVSIPARFLFTMTLMFVDDAGRMEYSPKRLKMQVFPGDREHDLDIEPLVKELCDVGVFLRYDIDKRRFLCIPNFLKHQKIHKPTPSNIPEPQNVPHGTPIKNREEVISPVETEKKTKELELELELDSSLPPKNSDFLVEQIFRTYPDGEVRARGRVMGIPPVDANAIIGAINRHGVNCVLDGTRCYAKAVTQWPPGERQKVFGCARFFNEQMYLHGPEKWVRSNGKQPSKNSQRTDRNQQVLRESLKRHLGGEGAGSGGEGDGLQGTDGLGERPVAETSRQLPSGRD